MGIGAKLMGIFGVDTSSALFGGERWVSLGLMLFLVTVAYMRLQEVATGLETTPYLVALGPLMTGSLIATFMSAYVYELQESGTGKVQRVLGGFWLSPAGRSVANRPDSLDRGRNRVADLSPANLWTRQSRALSHMTSCVGIALLGWGIGGTAALVEISAFGDGHQPESILSRPDDAKDRGTRRSLEDKPGVGHDAGGVMVVDGGSAEETQPETAEAAKPHVNIVASVRNIELGVGESRRIPLRVWVDGQRGWYPVDWRSKSPRTATVDGGVVTGRSVGSTQVVGRSGEEGRAVVRIQVTPEGPGVGVSMVEGIEILNDNPTVLRPGQKVRLAARVTIDGEAGLYHALSWKSYSPAVATVDDVGFVQAIAVGRTQITARAGSVSETVRIEVHPRAEDLVALARKCDSGGEAEVCFREAYWLELLNRYDEASRRFVKLCERGHGKSCWHLARLDQHGRGEGATLERAAASFDRACNLGYTRACGQQVDHG